MRHSLAAGWPGFAKRLFRQRGHRLMHASFTELGLEIASIVPEQAQDCAALPGCLCTFRVLGQARGVSKSHPVSPLPGLPSETQQDASASRCAGASRAQPPVRSGRLADCHHCPHLHGTDRASSARLVMRMRRGSGVLHSGTINCVRAPYHDGIKAASIGSTCTVSTGIPPMESSQPFAEWKGAKELK